MELSLEAEGKLQLTVSLIMAGNVCCICRGDSGALTSQCSCRGTSGYVRKDCLLDSFKPHGEWLDLNCRQCKHAFYGQIGVDLACLPLSHVQNEHGEDSVTYALAFGNSTAPSMSQSLQRRTTSATLSLTSVTIASKRSCWSAHYRLTSGSTAPSMPISLLR